MREPRIPIEAETLVDLLALVDVKVPLADAKSWNHLQREKARNWAGKTHLKASDNSHVRVPAKPLFLNGYPGFSMKEGSIWPE